MKMIHIPKNLVSPSFLITIIVPTTDRIFKCSHRNTLQLLFPPSLQQKRKDMMKSTWLLLLLSIFSITVGYAQSEKTAYQHYNVGKDHLALEGYDAVSYFTENKPQKGKEQWNYSYNGVIYRFENEANRTAFQQNPEKYQPAYGGWCTYAMAKNGEKVSVNPLVYKISDGKLLLFYKKAFINTLAIWNKSEMPETERLKKGDQYWAAIIKK